MIVYKANNEKIKGAPKWGNQHLNFFTLYKTEINYKEPDVNGYMVDSGKSRVEFRFHSSKAFANKTVKDHIKEHGGIHVRYWIYNGIDKTEQELIEWALTNNIIGNDGITTIYNAEILIDTKSNKNSLYGIPAIEYYNNKKISLDGKNKINTIKLPWYKRLWNWAVKQYNKLF